MAFSARAFWFRGFTAATLLGVGAACGKAASPGDDDAAASADGGTGGDLSGASDGDGTPDGAGSGGDASAPADVFVNTGFPPCVPRSGDPQLIRLRGTLWTGDATVSDGEVFVSGVTGKILCVGQSCESAPEADKATILCTDGIITPGLINAHDHGTYNHLPRWQHTKKFGNRYQWQADKSYAAFKLSQGTLSKKNACEVVKWTELREVVAGTTSIQGVSSSVPACDKGLVRDLDDRHGASGISGYMLDTQVTKMSGVAVADAQAYAAGLKNGSSSAFIAHLAEGVDDASKKEWYTLIDKGLALPGVSLIHATGLGGTELADALQVGIKLIWSPQSNLDLYGDTTRVPTALNLGLTVALGPDWTPSGSLHVLDEMKCAKKLSDKRWGGLLTDDMLLHMVTTEAAKALGAQGDIGRLATGFYADISVFEGDRATPAKTVVAARPERVRLVLIGGKAVFGDTALMAAVAGPDCEAFDACGVAKTICVKDAASKASVGDVKATLEAALATAKAADKPTAAFEYAYGLWPLFKCGAEADALIQCDVSGAEPSAGDSDGDGHANAADDCANVWNPDQSDLDSDGAGDACDICPLAANVTTCPKPGPTDLDGDGLLNEADNCPAYANADQKDQDADGHGDVCDPCPKLTNPGAAPCPLLPADVTEINQSLGNGVTGQQVKTQLLVVTATKPAKSTTPPRVWAQQVPSVPFGGIEMQLASGQSAPKIGQLVTAAGTVGDVSGRRLLLQTALTNAGGIAPAVPLPVDASTLTDDKTSPAWRALLVQVGPVTVIAQNADADPAKPTQNYGEILVSGDLRVDDELITWGTDPAGSNPVRPEAGEIFQWIRGLVFYSFGADKIIPRSAADFQK